MKKKTNSDEAILDEARRRFKICVDAESKNRELALDDIKFRNNDQWDPSARKERESEGRPCLTINKLEQRIDQVTGDQRMNRMGPIIKPTSVAESNGQFKLAEIYTGIIRNIENASNAPQAYTTAFDHAVGHGAGYWRIVTDYVDDDTFEQDIRIKRIANSFRVYLDPAAEEITRLDAMYGFVTSLVDKEDYPDADWTEGRGDESLLWNQGDKVRIAEYFRRVPCKKTIGLLEDGTTVVLKDDKADIEDELIAAGVVIKRKRVVDSYKVEWFKLSHNEIFERQDFPSKYIPIIPCYGKELNVDGETIYRGVIRYAKDPQKIYNYTRTASVEQVALAPKAPWVLEEEQMGEHQMMWETANVKNYSVLPYKHKPGVPPPMRQQPPAASSGWIAESQLADNDIDSASGMYKASLGAPSNERSGKAINARKQEGDVGTFHFHDNRALSLKHTYTILVDMIPRVYDTERVVRIMTPEEKEEMVTINQKVYDQQTRQWINVYDLSQGKYDVAVDVGASYTTQRQQAAESMMELIQYVPQLGGQIVDLIAKNLDWPGADDIANRLKNPPITPEMVQQEVQKAVQQALQGEKVQLDRYKAQTDRVDKIQKNDLTESKLKIELLKLLDENTTDEEIRGRGRELINQIDEIVPNQTGRYPEEM